MSIFGANSYIDKASGLIADVNDVLTFARTARTGQFRNKYRVEGNPPRYDEVKAAIKANDDAARAARNANNGNGQNNGNNGGNANQNANNGNGQNNGNNGGNANQNANNGNNGGNANQNANNANQNDRIKALEDRIKDLEAQLKAAKKYAPPAEDQTNEVYRMCKLVLVKCVPGHKIQVGPDEAAMLLAAAPSSLGVIIADAQTNEKIGFGDKIDLFNDGNNIAGVNVWDD